MPTSSAPFSAAARAAASAATGRSRRERSAKSARNGCWTLKLEIAVVERRRRLLDRLLEAGRAVIDGGEGVRHVREQRGLDPGHRRDLGGGLADLLEELAQLRARVRQVRHHRREVLEERVERLDRQVDDLPAAGERVAEAGRAPRCEACRVCGSKVLKRSSNSTGWPANLSGIVSPAR